MRTRRVVAVLAVAAVAASAVTAGRVLVVAGRPPVAPDVVADQVAWVEDAVAGGADDDMQALFPEGRLFMHVLTGMAEAALLRDPATAGDQPAGRIVKVRDHLAAVDAEGPAFGSGMTPEHGIFHAGWGLSLAVDIAEVTGNPDDFRDVDTRADVVADALQQDGPFPQSHPGRRWPVDAVVAASGLVRADALLAARDDTEVLARWRDRALALADADLGLLPHEVAVDGTAIDGPRGSSQSLVQAFWPDVTQALDARVDERTWAAFTRAFVVRRLGVVGVREYPIGVEGRGDVDSGPLVAGISASASAVTLAAARRVGDTDLARALDNEAELFGVPWSWGQRRRMLLGVLPVADAFVVWARTRPAAPSLTTSVPLHPAPAWWQVVAMALLPGLLGTATWWRIRPGRAGARSVRRLPGPEHGELTGPR